MDPKAKNLELESALDDVGSNGLRWLEHPFFQKALVLSCFLRAAEINEKGGRPQYSFGLSCAPLSLKSVFGQQFASGYDGWRLVDGKGNTAQVE